MSVLLQRTVVLFMLAGAATSCGSSSKSTSSVSPSTGTTTTTATSGLTPVATTTPSYSCSPSNLQGVCIDVSGSSSGSCSGTFSNSPCSTAGRVGSCTSSHDHNTVYRYYAPNTNDQAMMACTSIGTYTAN